MNRDPIGVYGLPPIQFWRSRIRPPDFARASGASVSDGRRGGRLWQSDHRAARPALPQPSPARWPPPPRPHDPLTRRLVPGPPRRPPGDPPAPPSPRSMTTRPTPPARGTAPSPPDRGPAGHFIRNWRGTGPRQHQVISLRLHADAAPPLNHVEVPVGRCPSTADSSGGASGRLAWIVLPAARARTEQPLGLRCGAVSATHCHSPQPLTGTPECLRRTSWRRLKALRVWRSRAPTRPTGRARRVRPGASRGRGAAGRRWPARRRRACAGLSRGLLLEAAA